MKKFHLRLTLVLLALLCAATFISTARADDESPIVIGPGGSCGVIQVAGLPVDSPDLSGDPIDSWTAIQPDLTVYLTDGATPESSEALSVDLQPVFVASIILF